MRALLARFTPLFAALYAVAMLSAGLAHHAGVARTGGTKLVPVTLSDGTVVELCLTSEQPAGHHAGAGKVCDFCRLSDAPGGLPAPPVLVQASRPIRRVRRTQRSRAAPRPRPLFRESSQGPPR